jgi:pimeloyl-ACP methyl ester carboxylesterase
MKLDIASHQGSGNKPVIVFVHGLGMDKNIWINPSDSRILAGTFPLKILLNRRAAQYQSGVIATLYDDCKQRDYSLITWSQQRPASPIASVVKELHEVMKAANTLSQAGAILVGHSRGGLIARKYLSASNDLSVKCLLTISTPHKGSSIAGISRYIAPLFSLIDPFIPAGNRGSRSFAMKRTMEFLKSRAVKELLPASSFFRSLNDGPLARVYYASVGGTNPTLFKISDYSFPDMFEKVIPAQLYPEELKQGRGDGLVSAESSKLPWSNEHHVFPFNHAEILFHEGVRNRMVQVIEKISGTTSESNQSSPPKTGGEPLERQL